METKRVQEGRKGFRTIKLSTISEVKTVSLDGHTMLMIKKEFESGYLLVDKVKIVCDFPDPYLNGVVYADYTKDENQRFSMGIKALQLGTETAIFNAFKDDGSRGLKQLLQHMLIRILGRDLALF